MIWFAAIWVGCVLTLLVDPEGQDALVRMLRQMRSNWRWVAALLRAER